MINRDFFFANIKKLFGKFTQSQADGLNFLIDCFDKSKKINRLSWFAYILATIYHETACTMQPGEERGGWNYFKYLIGKLGIKNLAEANKYKGRGYVQLTGKTNYMLFTKLLGIDFVNQPELAKNKLYAWIILEKGMTEGLFTGKKLSDYLTSEKKDFLNARRIINGDPEKNGSMIAGYALEFYNALKFTEN